MAPHTEESKLGDTFKDYLNSMFPYLEKTREDEKEKAQKGLENWVKQGPMSVSLPPGWDKPKGLKSRILEARRKRDGRKKLHLQRGKGVPIKNL